MVINDEMLTWWHTKLSSIQQHLIFQMGKRVKIAVNLHILQYNLYNQKVLCSTGIHVKSELSSQWRDVELKDISLENRWFFDVNTPNWIIFGRWMHWWCLKLHQGSILTIFKKWQKIVMMAPQLRSSPLALLCCSERYEAEIKTAWLFQYSLPGFFTTSYIDMSKGR